MIHDRILKLGRDVMILSAFILALDSHTMTPVVVGSSVVPTDLFHYECGNFENILPVEPSVIEQGARLQEGKQKTTE